MQWLEYESSHRQSRCAWHRGCPYHCVTTKHAAAFVILLTIAGTSATTLACVVWCAPNGAPASACDHQVGAARLLATSPFVKEEIQLATRAALAASAPYVSVRHALGETQLASVRDTAFALQHGPIFALVLRL